MHIWNLIQMGIPFYFKKLFTTFGKQILSKVHIGASCENLYLDFNCLIHQCANDIVSKNPGLDQIKYESLIIDAVIDATINMTNVVRPTKLLYIGIDGLCPRAKMSQQRKRRYMSAWRKEQDGGETHADWDSNIITPGTRFMHALDAALAEFIELNATMFKFQIVLSGSKEPGEGEHKIFEYIKAEGANSNVIYGLDADLILLSMVGDTSNIRLLRERPEFGQLVATTKLDKADYIFVEIEALKQSLLSYFNQTDPAFINDYVMLSTLLGNDFIPPLSYLNIRDGGIEMVVAAYEEALTIHQGRRLIGPGLELDTLILKSIVAELARKEEPRMLEACSKYYAPPRGLLNIDSYPQYTKHVPAISGPQWRDKYYSSLFIHSNSSLFIESIVNDYAQAIAWVHSYYFTRNASLTWYYKHAYSPLAADLIGFTLSTNKTDVDSYNSLVENNELQLLYVLPPSSSSLLLSSSIMTDIKHGCVHHYPCQFKIHTFLKTYLWECIPVLPPVDLEKTVKQLCKV